MLTWTRCGSSWSFKKCFENILQWYWGLKDFTLSAPCCFLKRNHHLNLLKNARGQKTVALVWRHNRSFSLLGLITALMWSGMVLLRKAMWRTKHHTCLLPHGASSSQSPPPSSCKCLIGSHMSCCAISQWRNMIMWSKYMILYSSTFFFNFLNGNRTCFILIGTEVMKRELGKLNYCA